MSDIDDTVTGAPETNDPETDTTDVDAPESAGGIEEAVEAESASSASGSMDLSTRPDGDWLNSVEGEINDVDRVLKCLARDSATICTACHELQSFGSLDERPVLARCASTKQPR